MAYSQVAIYGMNEKVRVIYKKQLQQHEAPDSAFPWNIARMTLPLRLPKHLSGHRGASTPEAASLLPCTLMLACFPIKALPTGSCCVPDVGVFRLDNLAAWVAIAG